MSEQLVNGYIHVRLGPQCFAQIPQWFQGETVPDEYIFDPAWNREEINRWWQRRKEQG